MEIKKIIKKNIKQMKKNIFFGILIICIAYTNVSVAQKKKRAASPPADTIKKELPVAPMPPRGSLPPYNDVITDKSVSQKGLFTIHQLDDRWLFEMDNSLLGRDMLIVSRIAKAAADGRMPGTMFGYAGDIINESVVRFERGPSNKLFLRNISYAEISKDSSDNGLYRSVKSSNVQAIAASFDIKTISKDSSSVVIDLTDFIAGDNDIFFFDQKGKGNLQLGPAMPDKSYIERLDNRPLNIEIKTVKTYMKMPSSSATYELNTSIVLLPKEPMRVRSADSRVGYFTQSFTDFDMNPQRVAKADVITRFRLEPKEEDKERYLNGELVEPKQPIIFYIDPATPKKWIPYLIQGVNDWQSAFEQAGFKNAIIAREAPKGDSTWSIEDARHNAIVYKPSDVTNASGPNVHDPRSGEIIETHINWYHNIMQLLRNWYMIQAGAVDPRARKAKFDDDLMGELIRFVSSHEVGHALGLRHNFGASSTVPVDSLRNKKWVEANGHTPSIMDYARFNYVAQPEDNISEKGLFPRIGDYDKWAIEWGYRWWPEMKSEEEKAKLNKWIIDKTSKNKRLWFGTEVDQNDPRCQNEDLGNNAVKASLYGIKNLKRIIPHIIEWTSTENEEYDQVTEVYKELLGQFGRYMGHVSKNIGGVMTTPKTTEEKGEIVAYVSRARQKEAMNFLQQQLFTTPSWLLSKDIFHKTGGGSIITISRQQDAILVRLLNIGTIFKLLQFEGNDPAHAYTANEMLSDLQNGIFSELKNKKNISIFRRNLQKSYVEKLMALINQPPTPPMPGAPPQAQGPDMLATDMNSIIKGQLKSLQSLIISAQSSLDSPSKLHLQDLYERIENTIHPK